jgi:DNA-binding transcriptional LysR family regulator
MLKKRMINEFSFLSQEYIYFRIVYVHGSINAAARKMSLDAGSLSRSITRLEDKFQSKLFIRHKNGLRPTDLGDRLYLALSNAQAEYSLHLGQSTQKQRKVHVGFSSIIGYIHFSNYFLRPLTKLDLHPEFTFSSSFEVTELLKERKLDLALVSHPVKFPGLVVKRITTEDLVLCSANTEFQKTLLVHPDMLELEGIIQSISYAHRWIVKDYFLIANFLQESPNLMGIFPEGLMKTHSSLNILKRFPSVGKITALSWPNSIGVELIRSLKS